tara:strand:+ start:349 stop:954 length:606 start_codon:yes stop_codon:yes gene_type:complete
MRLLEKPWRRVDYSNISSADGIVVLSGGSRHLPPGNSKIIEWSDPDRFNAGIDLFRAKKSNRLIFTGGINPFNSSLLPEGDMFYDDAISIGIPKKNLFTTYPVSNTVQEAKAIKQLLDKEIPSDQKKIILVTSANHMNRAKKVFEREGLSVLPYPVDFKSGINLNSSLRNPLLWIPNTVHLERSSYSIREIIGRIIYRSWE